MVVLNVEALGNLDIGSFHNLFRDMLTPLGAYLHTILLTHFPMYTGNLSYLVMSSLLLILDHHSALTDEMGHRLFRCTAHLTHRGDVSLFYSRPPDIRP